MNRALKTAGRRLHILIYGIALGALAATSPVAICANVTWDGSSGDEAWLNRFNWANNATPLAGDVAVFALSSSPGTAAASGLGISFSGTTNNGANNQAVGAIHIDSSRGSSAMFIGNSSFTSDGILTLKGASVTTSTLGTLPQAILVHGNTGAVTIQDAVRNGTRDLTINLATAGSNAIALEGATGTVTLAANITGAGGLGVVRSASSSVTSSRVALSGTNTYNGDTTITSGRLRALGGNAIPNGAGKGDVVLYGNSWFEIAHDETINGLSGSGLVDNANASDTPVVLTIGDDDASSLYSGTITNTSTFENSIMSIRKVGTGRLTLSGANSYRGSTSVEQGSLVVNGSHVVGRNYTVSAAGTIAGNGSISPHVILDGTVSPGDSIGTLSLARLDAKSGSTFDFQLNPTNPTVGGGVNDLLNITGLLNLPENAQGLTFNIQNTGAVPFNTSDKWTLANYSSLRVTGTEWFDSSKINVTGLADHIPSISFQPSNPNHPYGAGTIVLALSPGGTTSTSLLAPSFDVIREVYIPNTDPLIAPKSEMHATGNGLQRVEYLFFLSGVNDSFTNSGVRYSNDNGRTWSALHPIPNSHVTYTTAAGQEVVAIEADHEPIYDPAGHALIKPWTQQIDSTIHSYYQFSADDGATWSQPKLLRYQAGPDFNPSDPRNAAHLTTNIGQRGQSFYALANGTVMVGVGQANDPSDADNDSRNRKLGVLNMVGKWNDRTQDYDWQASNIAHVDPNLSLALAEPDMAQLTDGRVLTIWRGFQTSTTPGRKWYTVSSPDALTISDPSELKYDDGTSFYSPSSMHMLIRNSVNGVLYWFGNITEAPPNGNHFRHPLVIAEVDETLLALKRSTVTVIADQLPTEWDFVQYANFTVLENPETHVFELYLTNLAADQFDFYHADALKFTINVLPVPEPQGMALVILALAGISFVCCRNRWRGSRGRSKI